MKYNFVSCWGCESCGVTYEDTVRKGNGRWGTHPGLSRDACIWHLVMQPCLKICALSLRAWFAWRFPGFGHFVVIVLCVIHRPATTRCRMGLCSRFRFFPQGEHLDVIADLVELTGPKTPFLGAEETRDLERRFRPPERGGNLPFLWVKTGTCIFLWPFLLALLMGQSSCDRICNYVNKSAFPFSS